MGIQKIGRHLGSSKSFSLPIGDDKVMEDIPFLGADLGDDSDDCELTELHCELGMVEGQLFSIPYELYDLPDLREILSLDTWNSCLTEEERFYLSAYLPDMDQQTFGLTMKELFDGSDLFFGNPLDVFFHRLRGGYYPPKVSQFREGLQFIQRTKYYYFLRSYHDRMTQTFTDMRRLWDQCELSLGVEERISMWTKRRKQRAINLLDLNKFPKDDHPLSEEFSLDIKEMKSVESKRQKEDLPALSANGMKPVAPNCRGKGVLKMKASGNGLLPNSNQRVTGSDFSEKFRSVPKGVLKIVPKVPSVWLEQSEKVPRGVQPSFPGRTPGPFDFKFSSLPAYLQFPDTASLYELPLLRQNVDGSRTHSTLNQQPQCLLNQQGSTMRSKYQSDSSARIIEGQIVPPSDDSSFFGQHKFFAGNERRNLDEDDKLAVDPRVRMFTYGGESLRPNLQKGTEDFSQRSLEAFPFDTQYHGEDRHMALGKEKCIIVYPRVPEAVYRTSAHDSCKQENMMVASSNTMRGESDIISNRSEKLLSKSSVLERFKDEAVLPLTYKRRKGLSKISSVDTGRNVTAGADLSSNQHLGEGSKAVKIKLTRFKDMPINK
ncbi:uncharacterized protein LOC8270809 [Ricinus communis]|uniref:DEUBAD domain-containing protein n=1 Tax=Ricinus communis TaxID=3988 RepID=B9RMZ8_RICCO|nr:uncharacterized protein LOC8270809 [Ricinus communis]XP_015572441.1 uncharacterized protein LOC8270809 [Ricinus communis]XP_015572442.1 uncharacterized protein LOC8270809 [Ricinus communis]XP_015572444.1 uncharacterized protein LOC8270809 [Ricinus communis]EEF47121.1 hypothetical protein RCOM_1341690 [Ricinus communis]|eukprot:XP_002515137.1 uncharacterized protein LOC8270809 [Ricinus communis]